MKHVIYATVFLALMGCGPKREVVQIVNGNNGANGINGANSVDGANVEFQ